LAFEERILMAKGVRRLWVGGICVKCCFRELVVLGGLFFALLLPKRNPALLLPRRKRPSFESSLLLHCQPTRRPSRTIQSKFLFIYAQVDIIPAGSALL
jgi:hypothetical protein